MSSNIHLFSNQTSSSSSAVPGNQLPNRLTPKELIFNQKVKDTFAGSLIYAASRLPAIAAFYRPISKDLINLAGYSTIYEIGMEFLKDCGGSKQEIKCNEAVLDAMYFDPAQFDQNAVFNKWRTKFANDDMNKIKEFFKVNLEGYNLASLMQLPEDLSENPQSDIKGFVWCVGAGNLYSMDPQGALMYLLRGKHVLFFNYEGILGTPGTPDGKTTCLNAEEAGLWLKNKINCRNHELVFHGKSMGTGPATYAATSLKGSHLIIDRGISSMIHAVNSFIPNNLLTSTVIENFYPYPNEKLIPYVEGNVLIIEAREDEILDPSHVERNFTALRDSKLGKTPTDEKIIAFMEKFLIIAPGKHSADVWYKDKTTQEKLSRFLTEANEGRSKKRSFDQVE